MAEQLLNHKDEALLCSLDGKRCQIARRLVLKEVTTASSFPRPLLTGHSAVLTPERHIVIAGGGATCFSMGTFWNQGVYTFELPSDGTKNEILETPPHWIHEKTVDIIPGQPTPTRVQAASEASDDKPAGQLNIKSIPRVKLESKEDFSRFLREGKPVVFEGLDLGSCTRNWSLPYLVDKVGADRKVSMPSARYHGDHSLRLTDVISSGCHSRIKQSDYGLQRQELQIRDDWVRGFRTAGREGRSALPESVVERLAYREARHALRGLPNPGS